MNKKTQNKTKAYLTSSDLIKVTPIPLYQLLGSFLWLSAKHYLDLPLQLMADIYRSVSKPLRLTPEAWLLLLGTGRVAGQEVRKPGTVNQPEEGEARLHPDYHWFRVDYMVVNSVNSSCQHPALPIAKPLQLLALHCPFPPSGAQTLISDQIFESLHS